MNCDHCGDTGWVTENVAQAGDQVLQEDVPCPFCPICEFCGDMIQYGVRHDCNVLGNSFTMWERMK